MTRIGRFLEFFAEMDRLKGILRRTKPVGLDRYENSAEHSWHVALAAVVLASHAHPPIDVARAVEILLVHDIPEIDAGDRLVYAGAGAARAAAELEGARRVFGLLPDAEGARCLALWEEYEARETPEAAYAYAIDRLVPVLQNLHTGGPSWRENDVTLEQVLAVNDAVGIALPSVWAEVRPRIEEHFTRTRKTPPDSPPGR